MLHPSLSTPAPLRHNCPSLQRVALGASHNWGWISANGQCRTGDPSACLKGGPILWSTETSSCRAFLPLPIPSTCCTFPRQSLNQGLLPQGLWRKLSSKSEHLQRIPDVLWWAPTGVMATDCQSAMVAAWWSTVYSFPTWISWSSLVNLIDGTSLGFLQKALPLKTTMSTPKELI